MNQILTVATIAGEAADVVTCTFQRWSALRCPVAGEPMLMDSDQWPPDCRAEMRQFAEDMRSNAGLPPVVFYNQHADMWSMGDVFRTGFPENGNPLYQVMVGDDLELLCYAIPDGNALEEHLRRALRRKHFAEETKSYLRILQEAATAWQALVAKAAIVVLRQLIGGLVEDDEIRQANKLIPRWLETYKNG